jgi:riboflavin transporter FmnP
MLVLCSTPTVLSSLQVSKSVEDFKVNLSRIPLWLAVMSLIKDNGIFVLVCENKVKYKEIFGSIIK